MHILFLFCVSALLSLLLTPVCRNLFARRGLVDRPDGRRKLHRHPIPRLGGVPIVLAYVLASALLLLTGRLVPTGASLMWPLVPAVSIVFFTGLADDLVGLKPWEKLIGQVAAAILAYSAGVQITGVAGFHANSWLGLCLTVLWLVGCTNAFNLIDGVDGLASGVGLFAAVTTLLAGLLQGNLPLVLATAPLAGALLGFLRYNFSPASIFLGDCGSLFIGFLLGCYGVIWSQKSATLLGMTAPLMVLIIPLLDTGLAIVRRALRGQPIFGGDRNHIHHRLLARGLSPRHIALLCYAVCTIAAVFSLLQSVVHNRFAGLIVILFCLATWVGVQHLGYTEFKTARKLLLKGTFGHILDTQISISTFEQALVKAGSVDEHWRIIRDASRQFGFTHVRLRLDGKTFEESVKSVNGNPCWTLRIPVSGTEYVNLTHECDFSGGPVVMPTPFAEALQRCLSTRALRCDARAVAQTLAFHASPKRSDALNQCDS